MYEFFAKLFKSDLMPHGMCYLWRPDILWLHASTDTLISLAYFSIPLSITYFVRKRKDLPFNWIFVMFAVFILGCGSTHVMEVWNLWNGTYRLAGVIKAITAAASVATAIAMFPLVPKALALPSPADLASANSRLREEIAERTRVEADLHRAHDELELRVQQRTEDLARANQELQAEIIGRKQLEEQIRQAQKMEALGRLAGGVSHDFNNLLMAISGYNRRVLDNLNGDHPARNSAEQIRKASEQATQLTRQLLAFSRKQVLLPQLLNLNESLSEAGQILAPALTQSIEFEMIPAPQPAWIWADANQMQQVILNLALNGRDAMPDGGRLRIQVSHVEVNGQKTAPDSLSAGQYVLLEVSDTGQGMTEEAKARMFEPFFTTKPTGAGTGLGLSIVYGVAHQTGGSIGVASAPGVGTTIRVYLPRSEKSAGPSQATPTVKPRHAGDGVVLLVEDSATVRALVKDLLIDAGYQVIEASNGSEALAVSDQHAGAIDMLLTDLSMPGMNGQQVASALAKKRPSTQVAFMSAYPPETTGLTTQDAERFLQKPFQPEELLTLFGKLLSSDKSRWADHQPVRGD